MSEETTQVWRTALTTRDHDLYAAAWTLFMQGMNEEVAATRLESQRETVIPFLENLIEDDYLYQNAAPGKGNAPVNALRLLGKWKVQEAVPKLLTVLETATPRQPTYFASINALAQFGEDIIPTIVAWVEEKPENRDEALEVLEKVAVGNTEVFDMVLSWIVPEEYSLETYVQSLVELDSERAVKVLNDLAQNRSFSKEEREIFREEIKHAQHHIKEHQHAKLEALAAEAIAPSGISIGATPQEAVAEAESEEQAQPADEPTSDEA